MVTLKEFSFQKTAVIFYLNCVGEHRMERHHLSQVVKWSSVRGSRSKYASYELIKNGEMVTILLSCTYKIRPSEPEVCNIANKSPSTLTSVW